ncbi:MAG: tripartite tricarboxylate transporter TctB family protein [Burkholderiales bacterium]
MSPIIRNPKDFWTGVLYIAFGVAGLVIAKDYGMGAASKMGPGYFPMVLSALLALFGVIALLRSFIRPGVSLGEFAWRPCLYICASIVLFGALLRPAGLIIALLALTLVSAAGSAHFKFSWRAALALIGLVAFCALVFVKGLKVPMALLGTWFAN